MKGRNLQTLPPMKHNNTLLTDPYIKSEILNEYFVKQTYLNDENVATPLLKKNTDHKIDQINITQQEVKDQMKRIGIHKALGPDLISPYVLNKCSETLYYPIWKIMRRSLENETLPDDWKRANVTPIYKKGEKDIPSNYRPIALTSVVCKLLEKILFKHLYNFLHSNNLISQYQSGFKPGDGTTNQLVDLLNSIYESFDNGKQVRAVFLDISKAFDRVWIQGLLSKLHANGIRGKLLRWIKQYLTNRKQRVSVDNNYSSWAVTKAGVPQGSVLGPLLFLVFINDLTDDLQCNTKLFADDTMLYLTVEDPIISARLLNDDLRKIDKWSKKWLVTFNPKKSESITFSLKSNNVNHPSLYLDSEPIQEVTHHTHLGLTINSNGKWDNHISSIVAIANYSMNALRKLKYHLDKVSLEKIYLSYIRPILEYGSIIWDNCTVAQSVKLENVQLDVARIITGAVKGTKHRLLYSETGWQTLSERRDLNQLTLMYKMLNGLTPKYLSLLVSRQRRNTYHLRNSTDITPIFAQTNVYMNSFLPKTIRLWNELSDNIKFSTSPAAFKTKLYIQRNRTKVPKYYNSGSRLGQILQARLRMECSNLNHHLVVRHIQTSEDCECGAKTEDVDHYFFHCPRYAIQRNEMERKLQPLSLNTEVNTKLLLFGSKKLNEKDNKLIMETVIKFIIASDRFHND